VGEEVALSTAGEKMKRTSKWLIRCMALRWRIVFIEKPRVLLY
jgi:hypothetical protein